MEVNLKPAIVRQTLYDQVYQILAQRIADGELPQNSYLPNEFELSREFNVSIGTIRKAVDMLVQERLLLRQQGRGTVVSDKRWLDVRDKTNRVRQGVAAQVLNWQGRTLDAVQIVADDEVAARLRLKAGEAVHYVRRICTSTCGSKIVEKSYVPMRLIEAPQAAAVMQASGGDMLVDALIAPCNRAIGRVDEACIAVMASENAAKLMQIAVGDPLLKMIRIVHDKEGAPIEYRVAYLHARDSYFYTRVG